MAASTVFFFLRLGSFAERYKAALCFTGLVTFIAMYHYFRIFDSFNAAYTPCETINGTVNYAKCDPDLYGYSATGIPFNDAYRYVDWFLTVPLLLIEIVLVMKLSEAETFNRCVTLGVSSALMIAMATLVRSPPTPAPGGCSGLCPWRLSPTSCTPSSSASRLPRTPSLRLSATRSGGHAGQPSSRGAPTLSSSSSL